MNDKFIVYAVTIDRATRPRLVTKWVLALDAVAASMAAVEAEPGGTRVVRIEELGALEALDSRVKIGFSSEL